MLSMLTAIVATADARQKEYESEGKTGPVSLAEVARRREEAAIKLDSVPRQPMKPIKGATPESLREASAGYPQSLAEQARKWQHEASAQHPPNALPEYWQRQNLSRILGKDKYAPNVYTMVHPELPPDLSAFEEDH